MAQTGINWSKGPTAGKRTPFFKNTGMRNWRSTAICLEPEATGSFIKPEICGISDLSRKGTTFDQSPKGC
jgi:hypothetical protein